MPPHDYDRMRILWRHPTTEAKTVGPVSEGSIGHCSLIYSGISALDNGCEGYGMRQNEITTEFGQLQVKYSTRGNASYSVEVYHRGLNKHRLVHGPDERVV